MHKRIDVSVVVPCRNEIRHISRFLDSVFAQHAPGIDFEILIADGMSDDGTREVLERYLREHGEEDECTEPCAEPRRGAHYKRPSLLVIDNVQQLVSPGLNAGIRAARGEIIVRMDVHTEYAQNYLSKCIEILNETGAANVGGPALTRADGYVARAIALGFHVRFASGGARFRDANYEGYVDTVPYGCWRKSTLLNVGLFDESLVRSQDDELNVRIAASGGKIWQSPKIISWYRPRTTLAQLFRQYFQYGFWKATVIRKHRRPAALRNLVPGASLLAAIILTLGACVATVAGQARLRNDFLAEWVGLLGLYFAASLFVSIVSAHEFGWEFLPVLPVVFAAYHLSYALGSVLGFSYRPSVRPGPNPVQKALTAITR
jgi:glycosyltransferase involved in cell wall biosynthesis